MLLAKKIRHVRPRHQFFTLCYPAMYVRLEGNTVLLPTGGGRGKKDKPYPTIHAGLTEAPPEGYREVAISRDTRGTITLLLSIRLRKRRSNQET